MAFVTLYQGVVFIEGEHPRAKVKYGADTRVKGFDAHFRNLNDLKKKMAETAIKYGCNCVVDFSYGQRTNFIAIDDMAFIGSGYYAVLTKEDYDSIVSQF